MWRTRPPLAASYDAVLVGGGLHSLATAYFFARDHGMTDIAVLEKHYVVFGGSGRNTAIVRANQRTQENVPLYQEALDLWPVLTRELDFNLMFYRCGNLNLCHSEAAAGMHMARYMATGECPRRLRPFRLRRYREHRLMGETATPIDYSPWN